MATWNDGTTDTVLSRLGEIMEVIRGIDNWPNIASGTNLEKGPE